MSEQKFEIEKSQDNLFMCFICQTKFDKYGLETHYMETHNDVQNENLNKSESFDKSLESGKLRTHIKTVHKGQKDFKCDPCGKSFTSAGYLRKHIKTIHEVQKNFKCDSCGKSFTQASNLMKTIHVDQRYFKCDSCG